MPRPITAPSMALPVAMPQAKPAMIGATDAPVVRVSREPGALDESAGTDFELVLTAWPAPQHGPLAGTPAGTSLRIARTSAHGFPAAWHNPRPA